jgi:Amt family ammonium transporter
MNCKRLLLLCLFLSGAAVSFGQTPATASPPAPAIDKADTVWVLVSSVLVLLMTPGLALFYGGMVRRKNILSTMMHSFIMMGIVSVLWMVIGYSLAFGHTTNGLLAASNTCSETGFR